MENRKSLYGREPEQRVKKASKGYSYYHHGNQAEGEIQYQSGLTFNQIGWDDKSTAQHSARDHKKEIVIQGTVVVCDRPVGDSSGYIPPWSWRAPVMDQPPISAKKQHRDSKRMRQLEGMLETSLRHQHRLMEIAHAKK